MLTPDAIVVGGSAGAVDAVGMLLGALPVTFEPALIVVIHVPPTHDNLLASVLARRCVRPVREAADKEPVEGGIVYIAPPSYHLLVEPDRTFALSMDDPVNFSRPSIDVLFESAAYAWGERLLGIVLTGANADGAEGLARIRAFGGGAWVQRPDTAVAEMMPSRAVERAGADRILTLDEMAQALATLHTLPSLDT